MDRAGLVADDRGVRPTAPTEGVSAMYEMPQAVKDMLICLELEALAS